MCPCWQAVTVQGAGQAGQAMSPRVSYPISHSFVAPGGTRWDVSCRSLETRGHIQNQTEMLLAATGLWEVDVCLCLRTALSLKHEHRFTGTLVLACLPCAFIGSSNGCISYIFHDIPISKARAPWKIDPSTDPSKQLLQSFRTAFNSFFRSDPKCTRRRQHARRCARRCAWRARVRASANVCDPGACVEKRMRFIAMDKKTMERWK